MSSHKTPSTSSSRGRRSSSILDLSDTDDDDSVVLLDGPPVFGSRARTHHSGNTSTSAPPSTSSATATATTATASSSSSSAFQAPAPHTTATTPRQISSVSTQSRGRAAPPPQTHKPAGGVPSATLSSSFTSTAAASTPTMIPTPLGHVDYRFVPSAVNPPSYNTTDANALTVQLRRVKEARNQSVIRILQTSSSSSASPSTEQVVGTVFEDDEVKSLAPILEHLIKDHKLTYTAQLVPHALHSYSDTTFKVRVKFVAQHPQRTLSRFELKQLQSGLRYYLTPYGKQLMSPPTKSPKPEPQLKDPPPTSTAAAVATVTTSTDATRSENINNQGTAASIALGTWTCTVENVVHGATTTTTPAAAVNPRTPLADRPVDVAAAALSSSAAAAPPKLQLHRVQVGPSHHQFVFFRLQRGPTVVGTLAKVAGAMLSSVWNQYQSFLEHDCDWLALQDRTNPQPELQVQFRSRLDVAPALQSILQSHLPGFQREPLPAQDVKASSTSAAAAAAKSTAILTHQSSTVSDTSGSSTSNDSTDPLTSMLMEWMMMDQTTVQLSTQDWEAQQDALDEMFEEQAKAQIADLPEYPMPDLLLKKKRRKSKGSKDEDEATLFPHQVDGIRWLIHQEQMDLPSYFVKETDPITKRNVWTCQITKTRFRVKPDTMRGGILADDMGLGKTLQILGLILAQPPEGITYPRQQVRSRTPSSTPPPLCTLIVSPVTVMANWEQQIYKHVNDRNASQNLVVDKYHGPQRETALWRMQQGRVDVLLTSYHTLASEYKTWKELQSNKKNDKEDNNRPFKKSRKVPYIFDVEFHRIILDEAHIVRCSLTGLWKAVMTLNAERKLCLTGTPFVNKPTDIHSLLCFLNVQPLCRPSVFRKLVYEPVKEHREIGLKTIRTTMAHIALRRKKEDVLNEIKLVDKTLNKTLIRFTPDSDHDATYKALYETARQYFLDLLNDERKPIIDMKELLHLVLRIRQTCVHMSLVPDDYRHRARIEHERLEHGKPLGREEGEMLLEYLNGAFKDSHLVECAVCMEEMEEDNAVILRNCQHIFCEPCLNQITTALCPMCRVPYSPDDMIRRQSAESAARKFSAKESLEKHGRSPKIQALFNLIDQMKPDEKAVIFSQWTSVLDIIELEFRTYGHTLTRIDGSMDANQRLDAMMAFDTEETHKPNTPQFLLCSIMACGTGINLTRGNVVFLMDPWWNAAAEFQAMDRVHRIGQARPVRVYRLIMKDSLEERMLALQVSKQLLGKGSMEKLADDEKRKAKLTALKDLFNIRDDEIVWH